MEIKHGFIVIDKEHNLRHFVGYEEPPTDTDRHVLFDEMFDEFGEEVFDMKIEVAPPDVVEMMVDMIKEGGVDI